MGNIFSCKICLRERPCRKKFNNKAGCGHPFCKDCMAKYIISKVGDAVPDIECPEPGCNARLDPSSCTSLISKPVYAKWRNLIRQFNLDLVANSTTINPDVDADFALAVESNNMQRCPNCKYYVELLSGCRNIVCRCGAEFCYRCGGPTKNYTHSGVGPCVRKEKIFFKN